MRKLRHPGAVMGLFALGLEATGVARAYGTLNKQLTFYEITDPYTIEIINDIIL